MFSNIYRVNNLDKPPSNVLKPEYKIQNYMKKNDSLYENNYIIQNNKNNKIPDPIIVGNDKVGMFFMGSITIVGLFIVYRMMEKYNK